MHKIKCVWCGKEFEPRSPKQNSCGDKHYRPCIDCGKLIEVKESYQNYIKSGGRRCAECRNRAISQKRKDKSDEEKAKIREKTQLTNRQRYGVDNPMQCDKIKERAKKGVRQKYGVDNLSQSQEIQRRIHENSKLRYGVDHYTQCPEIRERMVQGMISKYGDSCAMRVPELRDKIISTNQAKYGVDNVGQSEEIKSKMKETCRDKYGVDYVLQASEIRKHIRETCKNKYGCYGAPPKLFLDKMEDGEFRTRYEAFTQDTSMYIDNVYGGEVELAKLVSDLGLDFTTVYDIIDKDGLWDKVSRKVSSMESDVCEYIRSLNPEIEIVQHDRRQIYPYELDIYLPEFRIGIECNPTFTHNSSFKSVGGSAPVASSYHKMKTDLCETKGIFLFHIFGYEWTNRKDVILSMIANLVNKIQTRIYARTCKIRLVDDSECANFLNQNHRQGYCKASVRIGLYHENDLVSIMTFGKTRTGIGKLNNDDGCTYELLRFCSKLNTSVIGGASRLFKYFVQHYQFSNIISFSDRAHTRGQLYEKLGFNHVSVSDPGYVWVNTYNDSYYNRVVCQKSNLRKLFNDESIDIDHQTERQIMETHGYARVFDSGVIRWEYVKR